MSTFKYRLIIILRALHFPYRQKFRNCHFENKTIVLDNAEFYDCSFKDCSIIYGGRPMIARGMTMKGCDFHVMDQAASTIMWMKVLAEGGASDVVRKTFPSICWKDIRP